MGLARQHQRYDLIEQVKDDLRDWRLGRVVTVTDSGFSSKENMAYLQRAGGHYICGIKMRDGSQHAREALSRQGRYTEVRDNLRVKEVNLASDPGRRWIICHNPIEAERDAARREAQLQAIRQELDRIAAARAADLAKAQARAARQGNKRISAKPGDAVHRKAECALRDHPSLGRWLKQHPVTGRLSIDAGKVKAEANLDGKYLLATSDPDLTPEDVALGYKNLLEAEAAFRTMKTTLDLRPVYHRLDERITAHVLLCWLALLLIRVAERRTGQSWRVIDRELSRVHQVTLAGPAGRLTQTTTLTPAQARLFKDCGVCPAAKDEWSPARRIGPEQGKRLTGAWTHTPGRPLMPISPGQPSNSRASSAHQLRNSGYRGIKKVHLEHVFYAVALNLIRLDAWWNGHPSTGPEPAISHASNSQNSLSPRELS